jgi:hypothetical protein
VRGAAAGPAELVRRQSLCATHASCWCVRRRWRWPGPGESAALECVLAWACCIVYSEIETERASERRWGRAGAMHCTRRVVRWLAEWACGLGHACLTDLARSALLDWHPSPCSQPPTMEGWLPRGEDRTANARHRAPGVNGPRTARPYLFNHRHSSHSPSGAQPISTSFHILLCTCKLRQTILPRISCLATIN